MGLAEFRKRRSAAKRQGLLRAARRIFMRDGYARAPMEEIARQAGISTATLYRHFTSKADLFEAVAALSLERLEAALPGDPGEADARLGALARAYAELLSAPETRAIVRMLVSETGRNPELAERFYGSVKSRLSDVFEAAVRDLFADSPSRAASPEAIARAGGQLQGMIEHATLLRGLILGDGVPPADDPATLASEALETWRSRWDRGGTS